MDLRFYIDPETGLPHIYGHRVREHEVEDILLSPGEDIPGRGGSRLAIGQTSEGRYLLVVYKRNPEPSSVFIITSYDLTGRALAAYRRRMRRRNR